VIKSELYPCNFIHLKNTPNTSQLMLFIKAFSTAFGIHNMEEVLML